MCNEKPIINCILMLVYHDFVALCLSCFLQDSKPSKASKASKEQMMEDIFRFFDEDEAPARMLQGGHVCLISSSQ